MKRILSLVLLAAMIMSTVPFAYATNNYDQGTQVVYNAANNENWTITVPAKLSPGQSGTVTLDGYWPSNKTISVDADDTVTLKNSILQSDTKTLDITFNGITKIGNNTEKSTAFATVSVAPIQDALFGTWSGSFYYNVETSEQSVGGCNTIRKDAISALGEKELESFVKISDKVFTVEELQNFIIRYKEYDADITTASIGVYPFEGAIALSDTRNGTAIGYCIQQTMDTGDMVLTPGFYLVYGDCVVYFDSVTIPGYTGFEHTEECNHENGSITDTALKINQPYKMQFPVEEANAIGVKEYIFHEDGTIDVYDYIEPTNDNTKFYGGSASVIKPISCRYTENEIYVYNELWAIIGENGEYIDIVTDAQTNRCDLITLQNHDIYLNAVYNYTDTGGAHCTATFSENGEFTLYKNGVAFRTYNYSCDGHIITIFGNVDGIEGKWIGSIYPDGTKVTFADTILFLNLK